MDLKARAKLNLSLNVTGRLGKMHIIESVILPIDLYDDVTVTANDTDTISLRYSNRSDLYDNDTALLMAKTIKERYSTQGVDVVINKRIPERAGLGGSSADAAAVARGMASLFNIEVDIDVLLSVGSDVPALYFDKPCVVTGRGEEIVCLDNIKYPNILLIIPEGGVDTGACYARYDLLGGNNGKVEDVIVALREGRNFIINNALTDAAISLNPSIGRGLEIMKEYFPYSGMTGSGNGLFGIEYDDESFIKKIDGLKIVVGDRYRIITLSKER